MSEGKKPNIQMVDAGKTHSELASQLNGELVRVTPAGLAIDEASNAVPGSALKAAHCIKMRKEYVDKPQAE